MYWVFYLLNIKIKHLIINNIFKYILFNYSMELIIPKYFKRGVHQMLKVSLNLVCQSPGGAQTAKLHSPPHPTLPLLPLLSPPKMSKLSQDWKLKGTDRLFYGGEAFEDKGPSAHSRVSSLPLPSNRLTQGSRARQPMLSSHTVALLLSSGPSPAWAWRGTEGKHVLLLRAAYSLAQWAALLGSPPSFSHARSEMGDVDFKDTGYLACFGLKSLES